MNAYTTDLATGETSFSPIIGGEVKQFVRGGAAITLVGSAHNGNGNSVIQDLATGEVTMITLNPGYDETTLLSPNEKYGIVMTRRFSEKTDLAVMGLMDRPCGDVLYSVMDKVYMYSVTGVRDFREGNIGPAIINVERSMAERDYMGIDVSSEDPDWDDGKVFFNGIFDGLNIFLIMEIIPSELFRKALQATAEHRESMGNLQNMEAIIARLEVSDDLRQQWARYQRQFPYAEKIDYGSLIETLRRLLQVRL